MLVDVSADMGSSGVLSEDINNPCRETELRKMFDKLKIHLLPEYIKEMSETDKTIDVTEEKKKLNAMLQAIFTKAADDMKKKKDEFLSFFQVRDEDKNKKKWKYIELAVQNFQLITFHEESTHYQTMHKQLGNSEPDRRCVLADSCYKIACLMALHNPPLESEWKNILQVKYRTPIKSEETPL